MPNTKFHKSLSVNKPSYDKASWLRNKIVADTTLSFTKVVEIALTKLAKEKGYRNGKSD